MRVAVVFNHPYEGSYCNSILESVKAGLENGKHEMDLIHLDNDHFDPVLKAEDLKAFVNRCPVDSEVIRYGERLKKADHLVFIFPIWRELMPALMKGFIDKVIFPGVAYDYSNASNTRMKPLLTNLKGVTVITTMNTPRILYKMVFGNAIKKALLRGTFWKLGYKNRKWINFDKVKSVSEKKRLQWLKKIERRFSRQKFV